MALTLGLDTSADACAVAVLRDEELLASSRREMSRGHAEALVPMVVETMAAAGVALGDLDTIGVAVGPGSFTGVRTGIAAARGFAFAAGARAVGVSSLEAVACAAFEEEGEGADRVVCILETRRRDYFVQPFVSKPGPGRGPVADAPAAVLEAGAIGGLLRAGDVLAGNAVDRFLEAVGGGLTVRDVARGCATPSPAIVARLARARAAADEKLLEETLSPLYLRAPEATLPKDGGRLRR